MLEDPCYGAPSRWADIDPAASHGLLLPGGHAPGMRQYLASEVLQQVVVELWRREIPVGAICHGVLVLARAWVAKTIASPPCVARSGSHAWCGQHPSEASLVVACPQGHRGRRSA
jgi:hypothetical protein